VQEVWTAKYEKWEGKPIVDMVGFGGLVGFVVLFGFVGN